MLKTRVIPCLLLKGENLVKTVKFKKYNYIGDPVNTVRIFNELEVDELIFLDITATAEKRKPNYKILAEIANECFMPLAYGGGINSVEDARKILNIGLEKVAVNTFAYKDPSIVTRLADAFGSQAVIGSIDVKKDFWGKYRLVSHAGKEKEKQDIVEWAVKLEELGAGELLITSVDKDGTWAGYDVDLIKLITAAVDIPVIASGGVNSIGDMQTAAKIGGASALALGSMVVYQGKDLGVLINFPDRKKLEEALY